MHLQLTTAGWDRLKFVTEGQQKDYDYFEEDGVGIFIYGYPFDGSTNRWVTANDVYNLYSEEGLDFTKKADGVYTIVIADKVRQKCLVIVDRYGIYSLFYFKNEDYVILSDSIGEIISFAAHIKLNQRSIMEYLHFGFKLGNKTHIEGICEFESATIYQIDRELGITENRYWDFFGKPIKDKMKKEDFSKVFNAHIATAMNLEKRISLPLSGGLDTRMILSACLAHRERLHCYTYGPKDADDVNIARKICDNFEINHSFYELNENWIRNIPSVLEEKAEVFNGLVPAALFLHVVGSCEREADKGSLFIWGILGNEIWRSLLVSRCGLDSKQVSSMNIDDVASAIAKRYTRSSNLLDVYKQYNNDEVRNLIKETIKEELLKAENVRDPINLFEFFTFRGYGSNWAGNLLKLTGKYFRVFSAHLQKDLLKGIPCMSFEEKRSGSLQKYIIAQNNSYLASVLLDTGDLRHGVTVGNSLNLRIKGNMSLLFRFFRRAVNKISRTILKVDVLKVTSRHNYPHWLRFYHREFLLCVLNYEEMITRRFFNKQKLQDVLDLYLNGNDSFAPFVSRLVSLEIWLKKIGKTKLKNIR